MTDSEEIQYLTGDATAPYGDGMKFIAHIVNDEGMWGSGFVVALSKRDREPEMCYRHWHTNGSYGSGDAATRFELGEIQLTSFNPFPGQVHDGDSDVYVVNMVAQRGVRRSASAPPAVDYEALRECLDRLGQEATRWGAKSGKPPSIHMPRIGCGLGGGDWGIVEEAILASLIDVYGLSVTVYDLL